MLFALVLAPPGTLLRFFLGRALNPLSSRLPISGTLLANLLATALLSTTTLLTHLGPRRNVGQCQALRAVGDGFCGSLSTVSTFVAELEALSARGRVGDHERRRPKRADEEAEHKPPPGGDTNGLGSTPPPLCAPSPTYTHPPPPPLPPPPTPPPAQTDFTAREAPLLYLLASIAFGQALTVLIRGVGGWVSPDGSGG